MVMSELVLAIDVSVHCRDGFYATFICRTRLSVRLNYTDLRTEALWSWGETRSLTVLDQNYIAHTMSQGS